VDAYADRKLLALSARRPLQVLGNGNTNERRGSLPDFRSCDLSQFRHMHAIEHNRSDLELAWGSHTYGLNSPKPARLKREDSKIEGKIPLPISASESLPTIFGSGLFH
jgi:hypothetical protein